MIAGRQEPSATAPPCGRRLVGRGSRCSSRTPWTKGRRQRQAVTRDGLVVLCVGLYLLISLLLIL
jgi:hypothetical protein